MAGRLMLRLAAAVIVIAVSAAACTCKLSVPPGGQAVHLTMDDAGIHLDPDTVRAGDVYLVIDAFGASPLLIQQAEGDGEEAEALSDERLNAVLAADSFHTSITSGFASGGEPYGNVNRLKLTPGTHLFATRDPAGIPFKPEEYARLTVMP